MLVTCPSGLSVELRGMKGKEAALLSDRNAARDGSVVEKMLSNCWVSTIDAGPYAFADGSIDWSKVLIGDHTYALIQLRVETFGSEYTFPVQCNSADCRNRFEQSIDLSQLPIIALSDANRAMYSAGNRFETRLPKDGRRVWFRLLTVKDQKEIRQRLEKSGADPLFTSLLFRIVEIEDLGSKDPNGNFRSLSTDKQAQKRFLEDCDFSDMDFLMKEFNVVDCGVDTAVQVECPRCWSRDEIELPFDRAFFLPKASTKTRSE